MSDHQPKLSDDELRDKGRDFIVEHKGAYEALADSESSLPAFGPADDIGKPGRCPHGVALDANPRGGWAGTPIEERCQQCRESNLHVYEERGPALDNERTIQQSPLVERRCLHDPGELCDECEQGRISVGELARLRAQRNALRAENDHLHRIKTRALQILQQGTLIDSELEALIRGLHNV